MMSVYGIPISDMNNKYVKIAEEAMESAFLPANYLVDTVPLCEQFPTGSFYMLVIYLCLRK